MPSEDDCELQDLNDMYEHSLQYARYLHRHIALLQTKVRKLEQRIERNKSTARGNEDARSS